MTEVSTEEFHGVLAEMLRQDIEELEAVITKYKPVKRLREKVREIESQLREMKAYYDQNFKAHRASFIGK
jgi:phosphopantothenate synthetase